MIHNDEEFLRAHKDFKDGRIDLKAYAEQLRKEGLDEDQILMAMSPSACSSKTLASELIAYQKKRKEQIVGDIIIVWDPNVMTPEEYAELVTLIGDVVRESGGAGLERISSKTI